MGWTTGLAVYFVVWWTVIFMVLPWGVKTIDKADIGKGHAPSAPKRPLMLKKLIATTLLAAVVWSIIFVIVEWGGFSFRQ